MTEKIEAHCVYWDNMEKSWPQVFTDMHDVHQSAMGKAQKRPFPSCLEPHFESEAKYKVFRL